MNTFTPTAASAAVAGFGFYALVWGVAAKIDTITKLFGMNTQYAPQLRRWINKNKGLTLCITEVLNFGIHGIKEATGVTFAIGGTVFNILYIFAINPLVCWRDKKSTAWMHSIKKAA